jgi:hypothetical protein
MRLALAGVTLLAALAGGTAAAEAHDRYYYPYPPPVRYVPAPRVYYPPPPPPYYYVPGPAYVVPRPVPYGYYSPYPYRPYPVTSFSFTYRGH